MHQLQLLSRIQPANIMASILTRPVFCVLLTSLLVAITMATPIPQKSRNISPEDEAVFIALDATNALLADPKLVDQIKKDVKLIRSENKDVSKTLNNGRKALGKLEVETDSAAALEKINKSKYGPATSAPSTEPNSTATIISFSKKYNPEVLSRELASIGVSAEPIWLSGPDYGDIEYDVEEKSYTFREGTENCKPNCTENSFWTFKVENGKSVLTGRHATDIPIERVPVHSS
ncbi:unnamed protein product [Allacma fusca]|uniref:Uncharacterized protein n=1 Tax=Allacma fusca TaxID=39272 RepID=A0A8J2JPH9_9HEXA|nr:unnamed protein product [Allacma fusca]